ncbi:MAG: methyltransferase domain-containing protein [bacterium]|nr:methyltransferase domain-containing protein [bacterium]
MASNREGRTFFERIAEHVGGPFQRFLDVGCEFGGRLVAAAERGAEVVGLERDPRLPPLARANCADCRVRAAVDPIEDLETQSPGFDLITCLSPVRQLADPQQGLRRMASLLAPGGTLLLQIDNPHSLEVVARDPNFGLFAFSLLRGADALACYRTCKESLSEFGFYLSPWVCREVLEELGLRVRTAPQAADRAPEAVGHLAQEAMRHFAGFLREQGPRLPGHLGAKIEAHFRSYVGTLAEDVCRIASGENTAERFRSKYLTDRWLIIARREGE